MKRTILIGDVHGCVRELESLLGKLRIRESDNVIFLGDLIDKGPFPKEVVELVQSMKGARCIMGNHEEKVLRWNKHESAYRGRKRNPVQVTADIAQEWASYTLEQLQWMQRMPISIQENDWAFVHGGFTPGKEPENQNPETAIRLRYVHPVTHKMVSLPRGEFCKPEDAVWWMPLWDGPCNVVYGHVVHGLDGSIRTDTTKSGYKTYGLDTGCVFGGYLSAMILVDNVLDEVVQVKAKEEYLPLPPANS